MTDALENEECRIWTIAGGKGGTGKSFLSSSLGIYLSQKNRRVILIDIDIGGANLHTFLGLGTPEKNLTQFFEQKIPLTDIIEDTGIPNLQLITGDIQSMASDDVKYFQKKKLFRHIAKLEADHVLIDIGSGSNKNVIDSFLFGDKMIAIFLPEIISIENLYHFVKNVYFRRLRVILKVYGYKDLVKYVWDRKETNRLKTIKDLVNYLMEFPDIGDFLPAEIENFKIHLVINKSRDRDDILVGDYVRTALSRHIGVNSVFAGFIEFEESIWKSVRNTRPFLLDYKNSRFAKEIETIAENILSDSNIELPKEAR